jgi:ParB family chromosome partitioning protein
MARTGLGRGLDALIGVRATASVAPPAPTTEPPASEIALDQIDRNPAQPRRVFDQGELDALAASIREHGVLQPVVVARANGRFRLIAGERRVQASRLAGLASVPAVIRDDDRHSPLELALIENLQRADLNAIEEAQAYRKLIEEHRLTQDDIAQRVGRKQSTISNTLRLLSAPQELQDAVVEGQISEGHLRALLPLDGEQAKLILRQVILNRLNVRQTEALARRLASGQRRRRPHDPDTVKAEGELRAALGTKVLVRRGRRGGRITIDFYSAEEFERLYELLVRHGATS